MRKLRPRERALMLLVMDAMLPAEEAGLPRFHLDENAIIFDALERSTSVSFLMGLRAMLATIDHLPRIRAGYRARFSKLDRQKRVRFLEELGQSERYLPRQSLETMKLFTGLAYFDQTDAREPFLKDALGGAA